MTDHQALAQDGGVERAVPQAWVDRAMQIESAADVLYSAANNALARTAEGTGRLYAANREQLEKAMEEVAIALNTPEPVFRLAALATQQPSAAGREEEGRLQSLVYVPGVWRCAKCGFSLIQSNLNAVDGTVTARDQPDDRCPNDGSPLWRVSYRDWALENEKGWEALLVRKDAEIAALARPQRDAEVDLRRGVMRAMLCLSGFAGEGIVIDTHEDAADVFTDLAKLIGMPDADDNDLRAALSPSKGGADDA